MEGVPRGQWDSVYRPHRFLHRRHGPAILCARRLLSPQQPRTPIGCGRSRALDRTEINPASLSRKISLMTCRNILGISAYYHDSAAALVAGGRIVAAAQEERFTRRKYCLLYTSDAADERSSVD